MRITFFRTINRIWFKPLRKNLWAIPFSLFLILLTLAVLSMAVGYFDFGVSPLEGTFPLFPYYSPHKFNIIIYSVFYLTFFERRFRNWAFPYFIMAYFIQESIDNIFTTIPQLLSTPSINYGFIADRPYNGGILWVAIAIFLGIGFGLFAYLKPKIKLDSYWRIAVLGLWFWIDRSYINSIVQGIDNNYYSPELEICRNSAYMVLMVAVLYKGR